MKRRSNILFASLCIIAFCSWIYRADQINKAHWLIGTWETKTQEGILYETWTKINDDEFLGKSYLLKNKDTVVFETIRLVEQQDSLFYIPVVRNQNEGIPVRFARKDISDDK